ncbi:MAG: LytTR family DNA-binding domain-containing protein [Bacteroidales bacterium]|nr:LytTR family DNA-binding domain-containing protein [Clostridium sp.]MCM1204110.1 LytTR family DNA-binding domain-containing protein [Bacteroidales bacterium]
MVKIAICDDEKNSRAYLSSLIKRQNGSWGITEYASAKDYLADGKPYDLLFLDIEMKNAGDGLDGVALARKIREAEKGKQPVIIFVTGYEEYVYDAFDVEAFHYLLKPVDEEKFAVVFRRAVAKTQRQAALKPETLILQFANSTKAISLDSIYYVESEGHKVKLYLKNGTFSSYVKIGDLEKQLSGRFFRIHRGYLINLSYVEEYNRSEVVMTNGEHILMSKYKYQEFVRAYLRYMR